MFNLNLAIKFGGNEISIYKKGVGLIIKEPAFLAVVENGKTLKVQAVGKQAEELFMTTSSDVTVYQPIKDGSIENVDMAVLLFSEIVKKSLINKSFVQNINALVAVPCGLNAEQLKILESVLHKSGVNKVCFATNAVCTYANLNMDKNMLVVDIGKYVTDISVVNKFGITFGRMYYIGGQNMDESITTFIQDNHNLEVSDQTSEAIKNEIASLYEKDMYSTEYVGIADDNRFKKQSITANEIRVAIKNVYDTILDKIKQVISLQTKEVVAEIYSNGVMFVGGGSKIAGLYEYATNKLELPVTILDEPADSVILGAGKLLNEKTFAKIEL